MRGALRHEDLARVQIARGYALLVGWRLRENVRAGPAENVGAVVGDPMGARGLGRRVERVTGVRAGRMVGIHVRDELSDLSMSSVVELRHGLSLNQTLPVVLESFFAEEALGRHRGHVDVAPESKRRIEDALRVVNLFFGLGERLGPLASVRGLQSIGRSLPRSALMHAYQPILVDVDVEPGSDVRNLLLRLLPLAPARPD